MSERTDATTPQTRAVLEPAGGFWTKTQAAAYLSVATHTIDYLVRTRQLAFHLIAGKRRFRREDLDAYAAAGRVGVAP